MILSRDVTFDDSSLGNFSVNIFDDLEEGNFDFDALGNSDNNSIYTTELKQTGKRKDRLCEFNCSFKILSPKYRKAGLEESSASGNSKFVYPSGDQGHARGIL